MKVWALLADTEHGGVGLGWRESDKAFSFEQGQFKSFSGHTHTHTRKMGLKLREQINMEVVAQEVVSLRNNG